MDYRIQDIRPVERDDIAKEAAELRRDGYRLGQICATPVPGGNELMYSFDKDHELRNLRMTVADGEDVQSITETYWPAFIYENEIHDLFGIEFKESRLDYHGRFFRLAMPTPWRSPETDDGTVTSDDGSKKGPEKEAG